MILDEPSEGVQPSIVQNICGALKSYRSELGTTIVFVEQEFDTILAISGAMLHHGEGQDHAFADR